MPTLRTQLLNPHTISPTKAQIPNPSKIKWSPIHKKKALSQFFHVPPLICVK